MSIINALKAILESATSIPGKLSSYVPDNDLLNARNALRNVELATDEEIERAAELHVNGECEIDAGAQASRVDNGYWVAAWVWVGTGE